MNASERVIVLAGSTRRIHELNELSQSLEQRGLHVLVVTGLESHPAQLLQVSFRQRGNALYLLCGGPELGPEALSKLSIAIQANGAPSDAVWAGPLPWGDATAVTREADQQLIALGRPVPEMPARKRTRPANTTLIASTAPEVAKPRQPAVTVIAPGASQPSRLSATPSGKVPVVPPGAEIIDDDDDELLPRSAARRFLGTPAGVALAGAAAVLVVGFGALALSRSGEPAPGDTAVRTANLVAKAEPVAVAKPEPAAAEATTEKPAPAEALPEPVLEASPEEEPTPEASPPTEAVDEEPLDVVEIGDSDVDDRTEVFAALESQSIRAIDTLLVSPTATKKRKRRYRVSRMRFDDAQTYCQELEIDGVGNWRLPEVGEVGWLSRANIVREGVYWTSTKADAFGTERIVYNAHRRRMGQSRTRWKGGRVVCVRMQRPDAEE